MAEDRDRILAELPLPLTRGADLLDAIGIAVAIEDGLGVTLPDKAISVTCLEERGVIERLLDEIAQPT